jgi:hypothetical protein
MRESYSQHALDGLLAGVRTRRGWDFAGMNVLRQPVPWEYHEVVLGYLRSSDVVLDVGPAEARGCAIWPPHSVMDWESTQIPRWCGWHARTRGRAI